MRPPPLRATLGVAEKGMRVPLRGGPGLLALVAGGAIQGNHRGHPLPCGPENLSIQAPHHAQGAQCALLFYGQGRPMAPGADEPAQDCANHAPPRLAPGDCLSAPGMRAFCLVPRLV